MNGAPFAGQIAGDWDLSLFQTGPGCDPLVIPTAPCPPNRFRSPLDGTCRACAVCAPGEVQLRNCSSAGDRVCAGPVQIDLPALAAAGVNTSQLYLQALQGVLAAALTASKPVPLPAQLPLAPGNVSSLRITPQPYRSHAYLNLTSLACYCHPCTACPQAKFMVSTCQIDADAVCQACKICGPLETVVRDCSARADRVCGGRMGVRVSVANSSYSTTLNRTLLVDGTTAVFYGTPAVQRILHPIAGIQCTDVLRLRLRITPGVLYALQTNRDSDFTGLIERALRSAESFLVPAAVLNGSSARRRLLTATVGQRQRHDGGRALPGRLVPRALPEARAVRLRAMSERPDPRGRRQHAARPSVGARRVAVPARLRARLPGPGADTPRRSVSPDSRAPS
jgi:hypothetical protein